MNDSASKSPCNSSGTLTSAIPGVVPFRPGALLLWRSARYWSWVNCPNSGGCRNGPAQIVVAVRVIQTREGAPSSPTPSGIGPLRLLLSRGPESGGHSSSPTRPDRPAGRRCLRYRLTLLLSDAQVERGRPDQGQPDELVTSATARYMPGTHGDQVIHAPTPPECHQPRSGALSWRSSLPETREGGQLPQLLRDVAVSPDQIVVVEVQMSFQGRSTAPT